MGRQFFSLIIAWAFTCALAIGICGDSLLGLMVGTAISIGHVAYPLVPSMIYDGLERILGPE